MRNVFTTQIRDKRVYRFFVISFSLFPFCFSPLSDAIAGTYTDSAHGSSSAGVKRSATQLADYSTGNCAHCHEQHGSIAGLEPSPVNNAASPYALFAPVNQDSQTENFCFKCHGSLDTQQSGGGVDNRSYSYRAGGWTTDPISDIAESFDSTSAHNLGDISTFINGRWGYNNTSNPCVACHNPHAAQGDPLGDSLSAKTSDSRGYPLSRPSEHTSTPWGLWGDGTGEKMSDYASTLHYQSPFRYNSNTVYEPDGSSDSTTTDGRNLTDMVSFCTDCHNDSNTIWSSDTNTAKQLISPRNLLTFNWSTEKHGRGIAGNDPPVDLISPYTDAGIGQYVLACTDCHEPHGSPNNFLIRQVVNKAEVTIPGGAGDWASLCITCHKEGPMHAAHHSAETKAALGNIGCTDACHESVWDPNINAYVMQNQDCSKCHYHGSTQYFDGTTYQTFNGGEPLF